MPVKTLTNGPILLANSIFNDFRPTSHAIRQTEQHPAPNFDRIRVGFLLILPTGWSSPTVSVLLRNTASLYVACGFP